MAKAKKKSAAKPKAAPKKAASKAKAKAPKAKKVVAKKPAKKVVAKKVVAKKPAPAKAVKKAEPVAKKVAKKEVAKAKPQIKKSTATPFVKPVGVQHKASDKPKLAPIDISQIHSFQMPNQRPIAHKPVKAVVEDRSRYSDEELKEFEMLILEKLEKAREEYRILKDTLNRNNDEGTDDTSGGNTKVLEDGAETAEKENLSQMAARQQKYITNLENALVRIKNGTYGICSVTGKLIPKERLIAVPHTTQSIEAKMMQQD
jgi:RNA polymerase-binding transcription factor DksA